MGLLVAASVVMSVGIAPAATLGMGLILGAAPPERAGSASGVSETGNELGGALGIALLGSLGTAIYRDDMAGEVPADVAPAAADAARDTLGGAASVAASCPTASSTRPTRRSRAACNVVAGVAAVLMIGMARRHRGRPAPRRRGRRARRTRAARARAGAGRRRRLKRRTGARALSAWRAMPTRRELIDQALQGVEAWEARWGEVPGAPAPTPGVDVAALLEDYAARLEATLPFFHPRYAGQMLKPPHPVAVAAYLAAMILNPNNHALDSSPATSPMEVEVMRSLGAMFGLPEQALGHLTSSGTIANLEALWVARELAPGAAVVHSEAAHYTHGRMCQVLGVEARTVPAGADGRIDLDALAAEVARGGVGTVVLTPGTTGLGAVDDIQAALELKERHGVRLHVDAAYGGFYALLGEHDAYAAIGRCDSVVVDPHKHGLQPYGCGAVLFADPAVGRFYKHDSPYTYFTSDELHLGEISLECSRAGAAAGALWLTLQAFPLERDRGLGAILGACRRAALALAERLRGSDALALHVEPALDIVAYWPRRARMSEIDAAATAMLQAGMADGGDPVFLSTLRVDAGAFAALHPERGARRRLRARPALRAHEARARGVARPAAGPARGARRGRLTSGPNYPEPFQAPAWRAQWVERMDD